jgi:hypothetical protein
LRAAVRGRAAEHPPARRDQLLKDPRLTEVLAMEADVLATLCADIPPAFISGLSQGSAATCGDVLALLDEAGGPTGKPAKAGAAHPSCDVAAGSLDLSALGDLLPADPAGCFDTEFTPARCCDTAKHGAGGDPLCFEPGGPHTFGACCASQALDLGQYPIVTFQYS